MTFDTKIAIVVRESLAQWQKLNVTAFLAGGLAGVYPEIVGERYRDGTFQYYVGEKIRSNDPKGVGPFIFASLEMERR